MKRLLLHICCAPDQAVAVERTMEQFQVAGFFSNSCIEPRGEYHRRLDNTRFLAEVQGIELLEDEYLPNAFLELAKGLEKEPERGKRCLKCMEYRLRRTAEYAKGEGFDIFATTLTVSPHKDADFINRTGEKLSWEYDIEYLASNFKKQDGFKRSLELSNKIGLYRQNYCGCRFSLAERKAREEMRSGQIAQSTAEEISTEAKIIAPKTGVPSGAFYKPQDSVSRRFKQTKSYKK